MVLIEVLLIGLASYRLWRLIGQDSITEALRARLPEPLMEMVACPWCLGFYVTVLVSLAWFLWPGWMIYVLTVLAASTIVGIIGERL